MSIVNEKIGKAKSIQTLYLADIKNNAQPMPKLTKCLLVVENMAKNMAKQTIVSP